MVYAETLAKECIDNYASIIEEFSRKYHEDRESSAFKFEELRKNYLKLMNEINLQLQGQIQIKPEQLLIKPLQAIFKVTGVPDIGYLKILRLNASMFNSNKDKQRQYNNYTYLYYKPKDEIVEQKPNREQQIKQATEQISVVTSENKKNSEKNYMIASINYVNDGSVMKKKLESILTQILTATDLEELQYYANKWWADEVVNPIIPPKPDWSSAVTNVQANYIKYRNRVRKIRAYISAENLDKLFLRQYKFEPSVEFSCMNCWNVYTGFNLKVRAVGEREITICMKCFERALSLAEEEIKRLETNKK